MTTDTSDASQAPDADRTGSTLGDAPRPNAPTGPPVKGAVEARDLLQMRKEIWEKAVDTQMHFNEMCVKSRQLGLSFVAAALGVAFVLLSRSESFLVKIPVRESTYSTHASSLLVFVAALGLFAVKWLDLGVYHRMLRGAVEFGECLERTHLRALMGTPNGMTELISTYSRNKKVDPPKEGQLEYVGHNKVTAETKIRRFYWVSIGVLVVVSVFLGYAFYQVERATVSASQDLHTSGPQTDAGVTPIRPDAK